MSSAGNSEKSPLEAAQKIVTELTGMTPDHQSLALKFAIETLGIQPSPPPSPLPPAAAGVPSHSPQILEPPRVAGTGHSSDIKSFTALKQPKSDRQFTAVVAYFYQLEARPDERKEAIDQEVMRDAARLAGWPQVERWSMTLTNAKNAGYLDAAGGGKFKLSSVGENLVAITLPGDGSQVGTKSRVAKKPKKNPSKKPAKKK